MFKKLISLFNFNQRELNGLLVLCFILVVAFILPGLLRLDDSTTLDDTDFERELADLNVPVKKASRRAKGLRAKQYSAKGPNLFYFDPNSLDDKGWMALGLSERQLNVLRNFQAKGGRFKKPADLARVYSISPTAYQRLAPYIRIQDVKEAGALHVKDPLGTDKRTATLRKKVWIDINTADSAGLESVRGLGPVLAIRILRYRDRLGGFYKKEQLREVYGVDSARYSEIEGQVFAGDTGIRKLNINTALFDDMKRHPYLSFRQMNAIIQYRKQHGPFSSLADLNRIAILDEEILRKIVPYLTIDD